MYYYSHSPNAYNKVQETQSANQFRGLVLKPLICAVQWAHSKNRIYPNKRNVPIQLFLFVGELNEGMFILVTFGIISVHYFGSVGCYSCSVCDVCVMLTGDEVD